MRQSISMDKTWVVVIVLFFIFPPLGFIAIIAKVIYMILQSQNNKESGYPKDYKEVRRPVKTSYVGEVREVENVVEVSVKEPIDFVIEQNNEVPNTTTENTKIEEQPSTTPDLTIEKVKIDTVVSVDELEKKLRTKQDAFESGQPLKVIACTMCGTENPIYKIDVFETPNCKKCGMLLLDRS
ncbi:MAG: hypothetical protein CVU98_03565 [Firmicutes bacterium HGW-Firmicutes-3]|nr:MAG: hypothetical protein CVU98_03565 [Firmicutes bacterium HGW-Firmicutes-3]